MMRFDAEGYVRLVNAPETAGVLYGLLDALEENFPGATRLVSEIRGALWRSVGKVPTVLAQIETWPHIKVDVPITDRCNLACKACSHFAPIANGAPMVDREDIAASLELLKRACGDIVFTVFLIGGEPLLHRDLEAIIRGTREIFPDSERYVVSNMLLYGRWRGVFRDLLPQTGTALGYSCYGEVNRRVIEVARKDSETHHFPFVQFGTNPPEFTSYLKSTDPKYPATGKTGCYMAKCPTLIGNYLYLCSPVSYLQYPNAAFGLNLQATCYDRIDLREVEHPDEVLVLSRLPHPFCRHCNVKGNHPIGWSPSKCERGEWFED